MSSADINYQRRNFLRNFPKGIFNYHRIKKNVVIVVDQGIAVGTEGIGFDSLAGQIGRSVSTAAMFLRSCVAKALSREDRPPTRYTHRPPYSLHT